MPHKDLSERRAWQFKRHLKRFYNMTIEEYNRVLKEQNGVCALCGKDPSTYNHHAHKRLAVDHDHKTGRIRGLICLHCNNTAIGSIEKIGLTKITDYLSKDKGIVGRGVINKTKTWGQ